MQVNVGDRCPRPIRSIYLRLKVPGLFWKPTAWTQQRWPSLQASLSTLQTY
jgi:hypothetical protein